MRTLLLLLATLALVACSSSHPAATATDAGDDAAIDAGYDADLGLPGTVDSGGQPPPQPDAGSKCDQLHQTVNAKAIAAAACDPLASSQCGGTTPGLCCPITISFGVDPQKVDDLKAAIDAFNAACTIDCTKIPCAPAPSNKCVGSQHVGVCQ